MPQTLLRAEAFLGIKESERKKAYKTLQQQSTAVILLFTLKLRLPATTPLALYRFPRCDKRSIKGYLRLLESSNSVYLFVLKVVTFRLLEYLKNILLLMTVLNVLN
ncbi:uncharacterized protein LOC133777672 [Humulus lupulus]|uniref:uncharacterized protein LOC133777672 n=1 Tax=Humulus lupulus TaxID=3486 RepID=UPI002B414B34|nr:uncharacterized protein LOC133777672 [Humulus lupulus]